MSFPESPKKRKKGIAHAKKILKWKGVEHGYLEYTGHQRGNVSLNPGHVLDQLFLKHGNRPVKPILFKKKRHYAFIGSAKDILTMQIELIRSGTPFEVIGLRANDIDEEQYEHCHILFDIDKYKPARTIQSALAGGYCWFLGPASPAAISAVSAKTAYVAGAVSHKTEFIAHGSFQIAESSHYAIHSTHHIFKAEKRKKTEAIYHLGAIEEWMINKRHALIQKLVLRSKVKIDIGCEISATNKFPYNPYDSEKTSSDSQALEISTELFCLTLLFILTGKKPSTPFSAPFLDAVRSHLITNKIPDYLFYREDIIPITVMTETQHACYLASVLAFFHKVRAVYHQPLSEQQIRLKEKCSEKIREETDTALQLSLQKYDPFNQLLKEDVLYEPIEGVDSLLNLESTLSQALEESVSSRLSELMIYVKTGKLSARLQTLVDNTPAPHPEAKLTDNKQYTYQNTCELLYFMKHKRLPSQLTQRDLSAFIDYTKTGIEPDFFQPEERETASPVSVI